MRSLLGSILNKAPAYASNGRVKIPWKQPTGAEAQMAAMGSVGILFAIVTAISTAIARTEWHLYRKAPSGLKEDRVEVTDHPALTVFNQPNKFMSRQEFFEASQQHVELTGEQWAIVAYAGNFALPLELWPVRPDFMAPVPDDDQFISEYIYTDPNGREQHYSLKEVVRQRMPNPLDPFRGMGPVQSVLTDLDSSRYSAEWNRNFFKNSAEPGGIIEVDKRLSDDEFDEMSDRWDDQHKGVANAHRVAIIEQGKWVNRTFTMRDMQFAELRNVSRDVLMNAFGISKTAVGIADDVNRAVALAAKAVHGENILVPRLDRWKGLWNGQFLPLFGTSGQGFEFDYESPIPEDEEAENKTRESKATSAKLYVEAGFDGESVKEALDLPDALVWKGLPTPAAPALPTGGTPPGGQPQQTPPAPTAAVTIQIDGTGNVRLADHITDQVRAHVHTGHQHQVRNAPPLENPPDGIPAYDPATVDAVDLSPVQAAWESALAALLGLWGAELFVAWIHELVEQIRTVITSGELAGLLSLTITTDDAVTALTDAMVDLADTAATHAVDEGADQGVTLPHTVPDASELEDAARQAVEFEAARVALAAGHEAARVAGPEPDADAVADAVEKFLQEMSQSGAQAELGSALTDAQNRARVDTFAAGPQGALYASEQMDRNTCRPCREIHGRWICNTDDLEPLRRLYPTSGYVDCLGRWRCRGTVTGVWRPKTTKGARK
ncbi:hypothetical protein GCM10027258_62450 [Amycolatopsis stemonae]